MLLDSNIIIYAARPENVKLRRFIAENATAVSALSYVEVLGYHRLAEMERQILSEFFRSALVLPITQIVIEQAASLRQRRRMSVGDAIIAATAIVHHLTLVTRNVEDFRWIDELTIFNPFE